MKIKMLTTLSGPAGVVRRGDEHECADDEALRLIEAGIAESLDPEQPKQEPDPRVALLEQKRDDLNAAAAAAGVTEPEKLPNKEAVADAILNAQAASDANGDAAGKD